MSRLIFLIFFPFYLISANLSINIIKDDNKTFSVAHIKDTKNISCIQTTDEKFKKRILCELKNKITKINHPIEDRYYKIKFQDRFIEIIPKEHFTIYNYDDDFLSSNTIRTKDINSSKHWVIIGFKGGNRLFKKKSNDGLAFPIVFKNFKLPIIGELDFDKKPLQNSKESLKILKIKEKFEKRQYEQVLREVDTFLEDTDNKNPFYSQSLLLKIQALDAMINIPKTNRSEIDPYELIDLSTNWLDKNPSDEKLPLVYEIIAKTYLTIGRGKKADKFLKILDEEYKDSRYNYEAKLYQGDILSSQNKTSQAKALYKDTLYNTRDFDLASSAALKLATIYLSQKHIKKAKLFTKKVLKANRDYLKRVTLHTYNLAKSFAENNETNISLSLLSHLDNTNVTDKDELDKNRAYWHELNGDTKKAIDEYRNYLKKWQDGKYVEFVSLHLDRLLLGVNEKNSTKRLKYIDDVLKKYDDTKIQQKALLQKAEILLKNREYKKLLNMKGKISTKLLKEAANALMIKDLNSSKCHEATILEDEYNLTVPSKLQERAFQCYKKEHLYKKALHIAKQKSKSDDIKEKERWYYKEVKILSKLSKDKELLLVANDLEQLLKLSSNKKYQDIVFDKVEAFYRLKNYDDLMLREIQKAEKLFVNNPRLLDAYNRALEYAKRVHDTKMTEVYAKKMYELQKRLKIETYSPKLEIDLVEALRENAKYSEALKIDLTLLYKKLDDNQRAHVLYLAGYLSEKVGKKKEAKDFYLKCGEIVEDSAWVGLCQENAQLLEDEML